MDFCFCCQHSILDVGGKAIKNYIVSVESKEDDLDREREDSLPRQQVDKYFRSPDEGERS